MSRAIVSDKDNGIVFKPLTFEDLPVLRGWLLRPHVARWWGPAETIDQLRADYILGSETPGATRAYIAHAAAEPIGFIQCYVAMGSGGGWWEDETDPGVRGIDQFLAEAGALNRGIGRRMIGTFVSQLLEDASVTAIQTDPHPANVRAIRCYAAVGFERIGEVVTPDGPALLMRYLRPGHVGRRSNGASQDD